MTTFALNTSHDWNVYIHQRKPLWNAIALAYTLGGYGGGVMLLLTPNLWLNLLGMVLVTHTLVLSAYLAHEFMHGTIFGPMKTNVLWGNVMQWLLGTSYMPFRDMTQAHIDHHIEGVDFFSFDRVATLNSLPNLIRWAVVALEWLYFPAMFFISQLQAITLPFRSNEHRDNRGRVAIVLGLRVLMFTGLGLLSLKALVLYFLAFIGMVNIVRMMDCLQHSYVAYSWGTPVPKKDLAHEQANTFSTPISRRYPWLNLLLLNFSYHNAHHAVMKCPWYNLPELDQAIAQQQPIHHVSLRQVLVNYHTFRISRLFSLDEGKVTVDEHNNLQFDEFYGVIGGTSILL